MIRITEAQPALPVPKYVSEAKTLEELWGGSTSSFVYELMLKMSALREGAERPSKDQCTQLCRRLSDVSGRDTATGIEEQGWPMDAEGREAIVKAARFKEPACIEHCTTQGVHNPECVAKLERQDGLMVCWRPPTQP